MAHIVLVAGAWLGGWVWERTLPHLRAEGHTVLTPSLSGLGENVPLANRAGPVRQEVPV